MTGRETTPIEKVRAVFLAALMVVSVFGGSVALSGSAVAANTSSSFAGNVYAGGEDAQISITDSSVAGNDEKIEELGVTIQSETGDREEITLEETGKDTATFKGSIETGVVSGSEALETGNGLIEATSGHGIHIVDYEGASSEFDGDSAILDDGSAPSITDADVVGMRDNNTTVRVDFSEPVRNLAAGDFEFTGSASVEWVTPDTAQDGYVELTFDDEIQTAGENKLVVESGNYTDLAGNENTRTSESVDSVELELDEGMNFVSAPFETGGVGFEALEEKGLLENVDVVWAFDKSSSGDDYWESYDPDADENELEWFRGGQGYVFVVEDGKSAEIDLRSYTRVADNADSDNIPAVPETEQIEPGWNLVGHYHEGSQTVDTAFGFNYDADVGVLGQMDDGSMQYVGEANLGEAYWVFTRDSYGLYTPKKSDGGKSTDEMELSSVDVDKELVTNGDEVTVTVDVTDEDGLYSVIVGASKLGADFENTHLYGDRGDLDSDSPYTATFTVSGQDTEEDVTIPVFAEDVYGETEVVEKTVELDAVSPTVDNFTPTDGAVANSAPTELTFDVSDGGSGVDASTLSVTVSDTEGEKLNVTGVDSTSELTYDGGTVTVDVSDVSLAEGDVTVSAGVDDTAGNTGSGSATFEVDTTPPSPSLTDVSDQTVQSDTSIDVTYDADSSEVQSVEVAIVDGEGDVVTTAGQSGSGVSTTISAPESEGAYSVEVRATDDADNTGTSSQMDLTVDETAPSISSFSVDNTGGQTVEVSFDSGEQLSTVEVSGTQDASDTTLSGVGTDGDFSESGSAENGFTYTATLSTGADGTFGATLDTAADAAGNDGANSESGSVSVDTQVETTDLTATNPDGQTVEVVVTAEEKLTDLSASDGAGNSVSGVGDGGDFTETQSDGTYTYTATYDAGADGDYTVSLDSASDANSNSVNAPGLSDGVDIDTQVAVSSVSASASGDTITVTVEDDEELKAGSISVADVDGQSAGEFSETGDTTDSTYTYEATISGVSDGSYTVDVTNVEDQSGNSYDPTEGSAAGVTVDTVSPTVENFAPSSTTVNSDWDGKITFDISDDRSGVDTNTLDVTVRDSNTEDGPEINTGGVGNAYVSYDDQTGQVTVDTSIQSVADGEITIEANVDDAAGNNGQGSATFTLDTTVDTKSVSASASGDTVTVTVEANEELNAGGLSAPDIGGQSFGTFAEDTEDGDESIHTYTAEATGVSDGTYDFEVSLEDTNSNTDTASVSVTVDNVQPTASWDASFQNSEVDGSVDLTSHDTSTNADSTTYEYGDAEQDSWTEITSPSSWDTTGLEDGNVDVRVTAEDDQGNSDSATTTVTINNDLASASWAESFQGSEVSDEVDLTSKDTSTNADSTTYEVDDGSGFSEVSSTWDTSQLEDGDVQVRVTVTDAQSGEDSATATVTVDNVEPSATKSSDFPDGEVTGTVNVTNWFDVGKDGGTATYEYSTDGGTNWNTFTDETNWNTNDVADGDVGVRVTVDDGEGDSARVSDTVTVNNDQPTATWDSTNFEVSGSYNLTQDSTVENQDSTSYAYSLDDGNSWTGIDDGSSWDTTQLNDGDVMVRVTASDDQNSADATETTTVTVDNNEGSASVTNAPSSDVTGSSVNVSSWFTVDTDGGTATYDYSTDGGTSWNSISDETSWDSTNADDGSVDVRVSVDDGEGNSPSATTTVTVDNNQPTASWDASFQNSEVDGSVDLPSHDTSTNADSTTYEVDDGSGFSEVSSTWDTSKVDDGDVTVRVTAEDNQGNSDSTTTTVTVNNVKPTASWDNTNFEVSGTYDLTTDSSTTNADSVSYAYSTDGGSTWTDISDGSSWDTSQVEEGDVTVRVTAEDNQGSSAQDTATVTVNNDADPTVDSATGSDGSDTVTVTFSEGVYANSDGSSGGLTVDDFNWIDGDSDSSPKSVDSVTHSAGDSTATLTLSGTVDSGDIDSGDSVELANAVYDSAGQSITAGTSVDLTATQN